MSAGERPAIESEAERRAFDRVWDELGLDELGYVQAEWEFVRHGWLGGRDWQRKQAATNAGTGDAVARLRDALLALAMRQFRDDGTWCWCEGAVTNKATHVHESECEVARAALASVEQEGDRER